MKYGVKYPCICDNREAFLAAECRGWAARRSVTISYKR